MLKKLLPVFLLLITFQVFAQKKDNLIPREEFFQEKEKYRVQLAYDGQSVLFQKSQSGEDSTLYFVRTDQPRYEKEIKYPGILKRWMSTYAGGVVSVVEEVDGMKLYSSNLKTKKSKALDLFPFTNAELLHTSQKLTNKILVNFEAEENKGGLYIIDLLSSSKKRVGKKGDFTKIFYNDLFSPVAAMKRNDLGGNTLLRRNNGIWDTIAVHGFNVDMFLGGLNQIIGVSKDGKTIYATDNTNKDKTTLVSIDAQTGEKEELAKSENADIIPFAATFDKDGKAAAVVSMFGDTERHCLDTQTKSDFDFLNVKLGNVGWVGGSQDGKVWLVREMNGGPAVYHLFKREELELVEIFNDYSFLDDFELASRKSMSVPVRNDITLPIHVYLPEGMDRDADGIPSQPLPTVVYVHGGPWAGLSHWNGWFHTRNFQLLANRGYAVINMEFRGTTGLGKKMTDAGDQQWGEGMHYDVVDVTDWAIRNRISQAGKVAIWGWSYGGYATAAALTFAPDVFAAGISMYGIADLHGFCQLPFADNDLWRNRVGDPNTEEGATMLKKHSPAHHIDQLNKPILLTTGGKDQRVPLDHVSSYADQLKEAGKDVIYFYYPEEVHDYRQPGSWISFWAIAEQFLQDNLGGRAELRNDAIEQGDLKVIYGEDYISKIE